jgi:3-methyladenine DNA glycosylase AlkD
MKRMSQRQARSESLADEISRRIEALGALRAQPIRALRREFSAALKHEPGEAVLALAFLLLERDQFAHRFVACELVYHHPGALSSVGKRELARMGKGLASWADVDTFALYVSGPAWVREQVADDLIAKWAQSPDRWQRRAAVVSTVPLCRSAKKQKSVSLERALRIFELVIDDRDPMVVKALSWGLRELAKQAPLAAKQFLAAHGSRLAALVKREVTTKLKTGLKNPKANRPTSRRPNR